MNRWGPTRTVAPICCVSHQQGFAVEGYGQGLVFGGHSLSVAQLLTTTPDVRVLQTPCYTIDEGGPTQGRRHKSLKPCRPARLTADCCFSGCS